MEGRDANGRFVPGWSPDRGRGRPPSSVQTAIDPALHEMIIEIASLPISIARGCGRRVVTLYEAQIRRLASGRVYRRASVMDFIRLVQAAAAIKLQLRQFPRSPLRSYPFRSSGYTNRSRDSGALPKQAIPCTMIRPASPYANC